MIHGVILTPMKIIDNPNGDIYRVMRKIDTGYLGFGEAYISTIKVGKIKGWKKHHNMTMNLVVPVGRVSIVIFDDRPSSPTRDSFLETTLSMENYYRITIPPGLWCAFMGIGLETSMILNISDSVHNDSVSESVCFSEIPYIWETNQ
jgi:dTDP-4-dehydrorhamnose 3,5-epimerase